LVVVGSIAVRPCTGALFLLILTWRLDLDWAGIIGALVMGLGTASITVLVAFAAVGFRESALQLVNHGAVARTLAWAEIAAGGIVMVLAAQLVLRAI
jgi:ABC-type nickel/cobalt efflux system permease component RcnA